MAACIVPCKCFAVRSLGWVEIPEEDLVPGKSSIAVNNCIQQLSHSKCEERDAVGAWGEVSCGVGGGEGRSEVRGEWGQKGLCVVG